MSENVKNTKGFWSSRRSDKVDSFGWGIGFIWAGLILIADMTGFSSNFANWDGWSIFFIGAGIITFITIAFRYLAVDHPNPVVWDIVWGAVLLSIGLGQLGWMWPVILIVIGLAVIRGKHK
jgi:hypothetical protein